MVQISMDGPNVNRALLEKVEKESLKTHHNLLTLVAVLCTQCMEFFENGYKITLWKIK